MHLMSRLRLAFACAAIVAVGSCVTPSIPVPPPDLQHMTFAIDATGGTATFAYSATGYDLAGAIVYVFDRKQGKGVIDTFRADRTVGPTSPFPAAAGDEIDVTFQQGDQAQSICVVLQTGAPTAKCL